jgi:uncharacterized membrane protein HdeD (DUF308 family)
MEKVSRAWGWALFFGFLTLVLGILVVVWPTSALKVVAIFFGLQLFVMGIYSLVRSFSANNEHRMMTLFIGVFSIIVAIIVIRNVTATLVIVGLMLGIYWIVTGLINLVMAVTNKAYPARGWSIVMAILGVVAGIVLVSWPAISLAVLVWVQGIWFIVFGILGIVLAFMLRSAAKKELASAA